MSDKQFVLEGSVVDHLELGSYHAEEGGGAFGFRETEGEERQGECSWDLSVRDGRLRVSEGVYRMDVTLQGRIVTR